MCRQQCVAIHAAPPINNEDVCIQRFLVAGGAAGLRIAESLETSAVVQNGLRLAGQAVRQERPARGHRLQDHTMGVLKVQIRKCNFL